MTHPSELKLSMYADDALAAEEAASLRQHIDSCPACQAALAAVRDETQLIGAALKIEEPGMVAATKVPKFSRPTSLSGFALANVAAGLAVWLAQFLWKTVFGELVFNAASWVASIYLPDVYAMASATALHLIEEGTAMFDAYVGFVAVGLLTVATLVLLVRYRKTHHAPTACLLVFGAILAMPAPVSALDIRGDRAVVTIGASETVDDTLIVAAETVLIEGTVTGDVVAAARRIEVSGTVEGNLLGFSETVAVSGVVNGAVLGAASSLDFLGSALGGDLWVAGETLRIDDDARIEGNATVASRMTSMDGSVAKDLYAFGETVEVGGTLGQDLEAFAARVRLLGEAQVGGDVRYRTEDEDKLHVADAAQVGGDVQFLGVPEALRDRSPYATGMFYLWELAWLAGGFIVGLIFLWLAPGARSLSLGAGVDALKTSGVGLLTLVGVPIMAVLAGMTLIGLPLSLIVIVAWAVAIYLAQIVVASMVGRMLLNGSDSLAWTLLAGLVIVTVAVNLPFIGGIISFVLTIVGVGLLLQFLLGVLPGRASDDPAPA